MLLIFQIIHELPGFEGPHISPGAQLEPDSTHWVLRVSVATLLGFSDLVLCWVLVMNSLKWFSSLFKSRLASFSYFKKQFMLPSPCFYFLIIKVERKKRLKP
jgi:hypothetical protein